MLIHVEKGDLHLLVRTGAEGGPTHGPGCILVLYCPQRRRGRLLAVDGFGSPRMRIRVLRNPMRYDELLGEIDSHEMAEVTGVYQIGTHVGRISLAYRLDVLGPDAASPILVEASYLAAGAPRHSEGWLVEGCEVEFAAAANDRAIAEAQAMLRRYGKRRKPRPFLGVPVTSHGWDDERPPTFERVSAIRNADHPREVRHEHAGGQADCPNHKAAITETKEVEPISPTPEPTAPTVDPGGSGPAPGTDMTDDKRSEGVGGLLGITSSILIALALFACLPFIIAYLILRALASLVRALVDWCLRDTIVPAPLIISAVILTIAFLIIHLATRFGRHWAGILGSLIE
jgi:hypothetical protein